ncbi:MAG: hypothetical protein EAZ85_00700 [Bacteroidetes bacterium]|nr:MAG: hypothetical protein EAZ85_00700 [Bacteroidota bacterium]TAG87645.1 MAG: hypothetical protein EAZ20_10170 [Bacteroidota bacterium]
MYMFQVKCILFYLPILFYKLVKRAKKQRAFAQLFWNNFFSENEKNMITKRNWRRINDYPFQFIVFFAEWCADLREKPISDNERTIITLYAGGLCLYDDFFDNELLEKQDLKSIYFGKYINENNTNEIYIFNKIQQAFIKKYEFSEIFTAEFLHFYNAQLQSQAQLKNLLSSSELKKISFDKGGLALVLSWLLLLPNFTQKERDFVYEVGAWFQILDDILDIGTDKKNNIQTLATHSESIEYLENLLAEQTKIIKELLKNLPYSPKKIKQTLYFLEIIGTSGKVHLYKLKQIEQKKKLKLKDFHLEDLEWKQNDKKNFWIAFKFWIKK